MNVQDKLAKIVAKDFTYVSVSYIDADANLKFDRFVVLTPSKPLARQAAEVIVAQRLGDAAEIILPPRTGLNYGVANSGAHIALYSRNYVKWAKNMVKNDPNSVYAVESTTSVQVGA